MEQLIQKIQLISEKYQILAKETGKNFNIFEIAHINTDEVRLCRVLNELINPNGKHCLGRLYLDLFLKIVLKINPEKLKSPVVEREKVIERLRRIDICITDNSSEAPICIPIEVKINAGDQEAQLYDYAKKSHCFGGLKVYYLTKYGDKPSDYSRYKLCKDEIGCISWREDILNWLNACICSPETIYRAPIREILQQFKMTVQNFTNTTEENELMETVKMLMVSQEDFKNAEKIVNALATARDNLWKEFCNSSIAKVQDIPDIEVLTPNDWNIHFKTKSEDRTNYYTAFCINANHEKSEISFCKVNVQNNKAVIQETYKTFSTVELAGRNNLEIKVDDCINNLCPKSTMKGDI